MKRMMIAVMMTACAFVLQAQNDSKRTTIFFTNDVHTHIDGAGLRYSHVAKLKDDCLNDEDAGAVFLVDAGDFLQGTAYGSFDGGEGIVDIMNAAGYDVATIGNHEFDFHVTNLYARAEQADFPIVSCNVWRKDSAAGERFHAFASYAVITNKGVSVAFVGLTTPKIVGQELRACFRDPTGGFQGWGVWGYPDSATNELYACVQNAVDEARDVWNPDYIVLLGHAGMDLEELAPYRSSEIVANTRGYDCFIDGHSHTAKAMVLATNLVGETVVVAQTGCNFTSVGRMVLRTDAAPVSELLDARAVTGRDSVVSNLEEQLVQQLADRLQERLTYLDFDMPATNSVDGTWLVRTCATAVGDLEADSFYWYANNVGGDFSADAAIVQGGAIRSGLGYGEIQMNDALAVNPFLNGMMVAEMSGLTILDALEWGAKTVPSKSNKSFLHVAGLRYSIATNLMSAAIDVNGVWGGIRSGFARRVRDVEVYDRKDGVWKPLDPARTYRIAGMDYLLRDASGGFTMLTNSVEVGSFSGSESDARQFGDYLKSFRNGKLASANSPLCERGYAEVLAYESISGGDRCRFVIERPYPADRVGVCSWSWATNMTTIISEMDRMGVKCMQLSLVPWVTPSGGVEYPASLRETFGRGESGDVFLAISNRIARGEISVLSTMISFPSDRWEDYAAISNSNGIVCCDAKDPLGEAYWTINSNLVDQAAAMTAALGVEYITTEIGYLDKDMVLDGVNRNADAAIGFDRLFECQRICAHHGVKLLFESGQYSGGQTAGLIERYLERYGDRELEHGLRVGDIGVNFDFANHLIYGNDNPTNAFARLREWVRQVHVKDSFGSLDDRLGAGNFAVDVKWGTADASQVYHTLEFLKAVGFSGYALVEHEWGTDRVNDIRAALRAILLANNDDPSDKWIDPAVMTGGADERCGAALKANGFSVCVSEKLSKTGLYDAFRGWARNGSQEPDDLIAMRGVILAAAYNAASVPAPETVGLRISEFSSGSGMTLLLSIDGNAAGFDSASIDLDLLRAAFDIEGTSSLSSDFSREGISVEFGTPSGYSIPATITVEDAHDAFFIRAKAE